jgi:DNA-binding NarL/FixJ family response regulator
LHSHQDFASFFTASVVKKIFIGIEQLVIAHRVITRRECEAPSWPAEGKTVADIAVLMKISPETATAHLDSARCPTLT